MAQPTAREITTRILEQSGVTLPSRTVDTFKAGNPDTRVTGIAVTMMATLDVLKEASRRGLNLVITHEPTFYSHRDTTGVLESENDSVLADKQKFIAEHGLVVWRFHDSPHAMHPDMITLGMVKALGWDKRPHDSTLTRFEIPSMSLRDLSRFTADRVGARAVRIAGNPNARISRVALTEGFPGFVANRRAIQPGVDALVMGEDHEWEAIEYAKDAISSGHLKGLIVLGHIASEQEGMREVARWITTFVKGVPVQFVPTPDPFYF
jgi:putative NIF3 family GTP cyclohydrolase 1 type 2